MLAPLRWSLSHPGRQDMPVAGCSLLMFVTNLGAVSPTMADQIIPDLTGAIVYDCRPPILPMSLRLNDIGLLPRARLAAPPTEDTMAIGGASPERVAIPELGVAPPDDSGTDLEDELLNISPLPTLVSPLTEPVEALPVSPFLYLEPPVSV